MNASAGALRDEHIRKQKQMYPLRYKRSAMAPETMVVDVADPPPAPKPAASKLGCWVEKAMAVTPPGVRIITSALSGFWGTRCEGAATAARQQRAQAQRGAWTWTWPRKMKKMLGVLL